MIPIRADIEFPLLETLEKLGGQARPRDIYPIITAKFPQLTPEDLADRLKHGEKKWNNRIQWTRQALIEAGQMISPQRGVWAITDLGRVRLKQARHPEVGKTQPILSPSVSR